MPWNGILCIDVPTLTAFESTLSSAGIWNVPMNAFTKMLLRNGTLALCHSGKHSVQKNNNTWNLKSEGCDTQNKLCRHFIWGILPAAKTWIGVSNLIKDNLTVGITTECCLCFIDLHGLNSFFPLFFLSIVFLLYSSQQEQTQRKWFCK